MVISAMATRFNANPALTMSLISISPEPNTMAFGGVATGIIKAQLAANAAGITQASGEPVTDSCYRTEQRQKACSRGGITGNFG